MRCQATIIYAIAFAASPALACVVPPPVPMPATEFQKAEVIVVGRVVHYEMVLDADVRRERDLLLKNFKNLSKEDRRSLSQKKEFPTDYARIEIVVDRVLKGNVQRSAHLLVTGNYIAGSWLKNYQSSPLIIGLQKHVPKGPSVPGFSSNLIPDASSPRLVIGSAICGAPLVIQPDGQTAQDLVRILAAKAAGPKPAKPKPVVPWWKFWVR